MQNEQQEPLAANKDAEYDLEGKSHFSEVRTGCQQSKAPSKSQNCSKSNGNKSFLFGVLKFIGVGTRSIQLEDRSHNQEEYHPVEYVNDSKG